MKTIGLLGGMSWESTIPYYRIINQTIGARLGGLHSARIILYSVEFHELETLQRRGDWEEAGTILADAAVALRNGGADFLVLCSNTMHKVAERVERAAGIPILHIADATADEIKAAGFRRVGLLGTRFTMEEAFYRERLERRGLAVEVPSRWDRQVVHRVIYDELCRGEIRDESRQEYQEIIENLVGTGVEAVILGCTEIGLLVGAENSPVPVFDTTAIHARAAAEYALEQAAGAPSPAPVG
jgi:aspartate racemase